MQCAFSCFDISPTSEPITPRIGDLPYTPRIHGNAEPRKLAGWPFTLYPDQTLDALWVGECFILASAHGDAPSQEGDGEVSALVEVAVQCGTQAELGAVVRLAGLVGVYGGLGYRRLMGMVRLAGLGAVVRLAGLVGV